MEETDPDISASPAPTKEPAPEAMETESDGDVSGVENGSVVGDDAEAHQSEDAPPDAAAGGGETEDATVSHHSPASGDDQQQPSQPPPQPAANGDGAKRPASDHAPMDTEEATVSSDSDIEEIEQPAGDSGGGSRTVVIDTESLLVGKSSAAAAAAVAAAAAPRPPPLTRAPPVPQQQQQQPHGYQQQHQQHQQHLTINPSVLTALSQYGINTAGMTPDQLMQLQEYYRRSHHDTEFVLEAPSFIVPYVMESPAELSVKQFMAKVTEQASRAVNGQGDEAKAEADPTKDTGSNKENKPDKEPLPKREEDFSHLGKWAYYYQAPVGQLLLDQGRCIVEEFIKDDLLKQQKRKAAKEKGGGSEATRFAIKSLSANLAASRKRNAPFRLRMSQCRYCAFETESALVMERHLEMPHMVGTIYQCNMCQFETRSPQSVLTHMTAEHGVTGRLERAPASFQCPLCPYEDSGKARMTRHLNSCQKKFRIDKNQCLDDWVPPAKVPKIHRGRPSVLGKQFEPVRAPAPGVGGPKAMQQALVAAAVRGRGRPVGSYKDSPPGGAAGPPRQPFNRQAYLAGSGGMTPQLVRPPAGGPQMLMPPHYQIGSQLYQLVNNQLVPVNPAQARSSASGVQIIPTASSSAGGHPPTAAKVAMAGGLKLSSTPSISITPVPRPSLPPSVPSILRTAAAGSQLSITKGAGAATNGAFVICEICDGYIKDLEQLRNHMQWIHKVKIHPKMIYNRPPLNCQKCQLRFFTDQGLERHLLGSHGLVTSSMQEAANKGHDSGRCPICGKVYQWKLLHHVSKDHMVTLKPAHLSYKCTVCTATFSMYKQFENHVYSSHSVVAKKIMESSDRKKAAAAAAASGQPIKLNDEITIIPHPSRTPRPAPPQGRNTAAVEAECQVCDHRSLPAALHAHYQQHHLGRCEVEFTPLLADQAAAPFVGEEVRRQLSEHAEQAASRHLEVEVSDTDDDGSGGGALSKLNKDITVTPVGGRPRRTVTITRPRGFVGPRCAKRRRRSRLAPRSVLERRRGVGVEPRRRQPSVVEVSDSEQQQNGSKTPPQQQEEEEEAKTASHSEDTSEAAAETKGASEAASEANEAAVEGSETDGAPAEKTNEASTGKAEESIDKADEESAGETQEASTEKTEAEKEASTASECDDEEGAAPEAHQQDQQ